MASVSDSPALRADAAANRRALVAAANRLFGERGADVHFDQVAREAGVGRATLYRHFPTRGDLLAGVLEGLIESLEEEAARLPADATAFGRLFEKALRLQELKVPLQELFPLSARPPALVRRLRARLDALFREPLRLAQAAGEVSPALELADVRVLLLMVSSVTDLDATRADRRRAEALARRLLAA